MDYLDDLRAAALLSRTTGSLIAGVDPRSRAVRLAVLVRLESTTCPHFLHLPGDHLFIVFAPERAAILTGFPVSHRHVQRGYPQWQNQLTVTE